MTCFLFLSSRNVPGRLSSSSCLLSLTKESSYGVQQGGNLLRIVA